MEESILKSIRAILVGDENDLSFDMDLIFKINVALNTLTQVGVGPVNGFRITGPSEKWSDLISDDKTLEVVKEYVVEKTRLLFDPPSSSFVLESLTKQLDEMLWRINVTVDGQTGNPKEEET